MTIEHERLNNDGAAWHRWGPYLSERSWGTVREDYSAHGSAWDYLPHDHARSRAYRWNEDGLAGICDNRQRLCFALALWNGKDPILKERLFGLTGPEGNHGEDVKEYYYYLDSTPTHSYMRMLYKYPQSAFPYADLLDTNRRRGKLDPEYELIDTGVFAEDRYFDVFIEYAKADANDILIRISATNRGPEPAELHLLPTLWFRNTWSWGTDEGSTQPRLWQSDAQANGHGTGINAEHPTLGAYRLDCEGAPELLFTENNTNVERLYGASNLSPYVKDGITEAVVHGRAEAVNPEGMGTKAAAHYSMMVSSGETVTVRLRLAPTREGSGIRDQGSGLKSRPLIPDPRSLRTWSDFDRIFAERLSEADDFYAKVQPPTLTEDERLVQRQAFAGMLWSKQFYHYDVERWLKGDPNQPPPPAERKHGRNSEWTHLKASDIISMPDKWEYPWFAAWDLAFHCVPIALVDPDFAKGQMILLGREWYQHPNGALPAYEWAFGDVNPPVRAWATWRIYEIDKKLRGKGDLLFLERVFHKLLLTFTWWTNRKDAEGMNVFQGGFLGLDNIGVFDRSAPLPTGGHIEQSDGTSWMGAFTLNMLTISLELARHNRAYEDIATKFFEHFLYIAEAMNNLAGEGISLWDEEDEFFYDVLHVTGDKGEDIHIPLKVHSMVGLIPLFAVSTVESDILDMLPDFHRRLEWFLTNRPDLASLVSRWEDMGMKQRHLLALLRGHRMKRVLSRMLDENEFLSPYGVRALSRYHAERPYIFETEGARYTVEYQPGESNSGLFGGNSNWRGPIWFPVNYLVIEALQQFHQYYGDDFKVECPTRSGQFLTLNEIADELSRRLIGIFARGEDGRRAVFGEQEKFQSDSHWRDYVPFHEYFHGDNGRGVGASHQTGWTGLVAKLIQQQGEGRMGNARLEPEGVAHHALHSMRDVGRGVVDTVKGILGGEGEDEGIDRE